MSQTKPTHTRVKTAVLGAAIASLLCYVLQAPDAVFPAATVLATYVAGWLPDVD